MKQPVNNAPLCGLQTLAGAPESRRRHCQSYCPFVRRSSGARSGVLLSRYEFQRARRLADDRTAHLKAARILLAG